MPAAPLLCGSTLPRGDRCRLRAWYAVSTKGSRVSTPACPEHLGEVVLARLYVRDRVTVRRCP